MQDLALVFTGGEGPSHGRIQAFLEMDPLLVAADSGLATMRDMGLEPDFVIGDFDSVDPELLVMVPKEKIIRHPVDKDYTDTELALLKAREHGARELVLIGGGGGRLDHLLGIVQLFGRPLRPQRWYTRHDELILVEGRAWFELEPGTTISFFPAATTCRAHTEGLQWNLDGLVWTGGDCGISNRCIGPRILVDMEEGALLMIRHLPKMDTPALRFSWSGCEQRSLHG